MYADSHLWIKRCPKIGDPNGTAHARALSCEGRREWVGKVSLRKAKPAFVTPMAVQLLAKLPEGPDWLYEVKWDGYRALLIEAGARVQIRSRNDKDLTAPYPTVAATALRLHAEQSTSVSRVRLPFARAEEVTALDSSTS
jgi:ATP-dependent DNA ligase